MLRQGYLEANVDISVQGKSFPSALPGSLANEKDYKTYKYPSAHSVKWADTNRNEGVKCDFSSTRINAQC